MIVRNHEQISRRLDGPGRQTALEAMLIFTARYLMTLRLPGRMMPERLA
jgi:hypothetical protein